MAWINPVTFDENSYYNAVDYNREVINFNFLLAWLAENGYQITVPYQLPLVITTEFPTVTLINRLRANIIAVLNRFYRPPDAPIIEQNPNRKQIFDYGEANKLERNLQGMYDILGRVISSYKYCGSFNCGEEEVL